MANVSYSLFASKITGLADGCVDIDCDILMESVDSDGEYLCDLGSISDNLSLTDILDSNFGVENDLEYSEEDLISEHNTLVILETHLNRLKAGIEKRISEMNTSMES